jgi:hypothetical protein
VAGPPPESWAVRPDGGRGFELVPNLWRLRLPLPWDGVGAVNGYALKRQDGGLLLVDCGGGGDPTTWAALEGAIRDTGHDVSDVREIVLTHYHSDHAGPLEWLGQNTDPRVLGHPDVAHFADANLRPDEIIAARRRRAAAEGVLRTSSSSSRTCVRRQSLPVAYQPAPIRISDSGRRGSAVAGISPLV